MVHPGSMWVQFLACEFHLAQGIRVARDLQPWRSMDKRVMPLGLAELEQLHVEWNSEHSTSLHRSSTHYQRQKAGLGLEMRLGYERTEPSGLAVLEQLRSNSDCGQHISQSQNSLSMHFSLSMHLQAPIRPHLHMWSARKAWRRYILDILLCAKHPDPCFFVEQGLTSNTSNLHVATAWLMMM